MKVVITYTNIRLEIRAITDDVLSVHPLDGGAFTGYLEELADLAVMSEGECDYINGLGDSALALAEELGIDVPGDAYPKVEYDQETRVVD